MRERESGIEHVGVYAHFIYKCQNTNNLCKGRPRVS